MTHVKHVLQRLAHSRIPTLAGEKTAVPTILLLDWLQYTPNNCHTSTLKKIKPNKTSWR